MTLNILRPICTAVLVTAAFAQTPEERAAALVSQLTLDEKAAQLQHDAPAIPRLNIPAYNWWNEALHGVARAGLATSFPQAIALAATWDAALVNRVAQAISTEARAKYNQAQRAGAGGAYHGLTFWSPNVNIFRDPRWGRGQETYGENPYLTSRMAVAFITGMQGTDANYLKTAATPKHFAVHSGPEALRHSFDAVVSRRDLENTYLPAFNAAIVEGGAASIMCAYNAVNGVPACANDGLLTERLRTEWNFRGYVVSDCGAITDIATGHHYRATALEAAAAALKAGTDLSCGAEFSSLAEAVRGNLVTEADLDRALIRLFTARFRLGMFDPPLSVPFSQIGMDAVDSAENRALALEAARKSIVLLENHGILPLAAPPVRIAVIGPAADEPAMQLANYQGVPSHIVTPLDAIRRRFPASAIDYSPGSNYTPTTPALVPSAAPFKAEYFDNIELAGQPILTRTESRIRLDWDTRDPANAAAVRWTGTFTAPYGGLYTLAAAGAQLYLDSALITAPVMLSADSTHSLRVEYRQHEGSTGTGFVWIPPADPLLAEAGRLIRGAGLAILCIGLSGDLENEDRDRVSIQLPAAQQRLLDTALATGKPVIVVLMTGSSIVAGQARERAAAVLEAWYPGQEGGTAIAETLAGDNNPSGRLPVTFYRSDDQLKPFDDYSMAGRAPADPLYPFGYGLSYSTFEYSHLAIDRSGQVTVNVTNTSSRDGDEVIQLYVDNALRAFTRVQIPAGHTHAAAFTLSPEEMKSARTIRAGGQSLQLRRVNHLR